MVTKVKSSGIPIQELSKAGINFSDRVEVKKITHAYEVYLKLNGLFHLFLKTLASETGDSVQDWKYRLKLRAGFGDVIRDQDGYKAFAPWSFSFTDTTAEQRSDLFRDSIIYIIESGIMDCSGFIADYHEMTGKHLIGGI
jgi:uncharacterized protein YegP (UPF0339 family)